MTHAKKEIVTDSNHLTDAWIAKLNATASENDWNAVAGEIKAAYGGWPADWYERVLEGDIMRNAQARFTPAGGPMAMLTLKNGKKEPEPLVVVTMLALQDLIALPIAFYEFVMLCRDRSHKLWSNTESILRERNLLEQDGQPHSSIRNIVTAAVAGDGLAMVLGSPLK